MNSLKAPCLLLTELTKPYFLAVSSVVDRPHSQNQPVSGSSSMTYLARLKLLKSAGATHDETDEKALSSVSSVPSGPLSGNRNPLPMAQILELRALITTCAHPDEVEPLMTAALRSGPSAVAIYREIVATNTYLETHEHGTTTGS